MKKLFLFVVVAVGLSACKKDAPAEPSKIELLTAKSWRVSAATTTSSSGTTDDFKNYLACERDDFATFYPNNSALFSEGPVSCNSVDYQTRTRSWDFNTKQTQLALPGTTKRYALTGGGGLIWYDLLELSATTLRVQLTNPNLTPATTQQITFTAF
jgi:hypothetical protein